MVSIWTPCGFHVDTMWLPHGHHMVSRWTPYDFYVDTMGGWKPQSNQRRMVTKESPWEGGKNAWQPWEGGNHGITTVRGHHKEW